MHLDEQKYQEAKLIALLAEDSEYAFQLIYDHYRNRIYKLSMLYLKSPVLAQEVVQDVFLKLWFSRRNIKTDVSLQPWLLTVTKNHLLNQLKSIAHQWVKLPDDVFNEKIMTDPVFDEVCYKEYKVHLSTAIDKLSHNQREVFLLAREEGLSYLQIAERLGISALTVKTHMSRALKAIKNYLQENKVLSFVPAIILPLTEQLLH